MQSTATPINYANFYDIAFNLAGKDMRPDAEAILALAQHAQKLEEKLASRGTPGRPRTVRTASPVTEPETVSV